MKRILFMILALHCGQATADGPSAAPPNEAKWAGSFSMNGISLAHYKEFAAKWRLVTARYRKDTGELRFIFANGSAWKTLNAGKTNYSKGSVFAKISYFLSHDPAFPTSLVPADVARYQLMVRDEEKYAGTGGWGYALFGSDGKTQAGNPLAVAKSCNACHQVVADKGGIFAAPAPAFGGILAKAKTGTVDAFPRLKFLNRPARELPEDLRDLLPKDSERVLLLTGKLASAPFEGTLNELWPYLAQESQRNDGIPAVLLSHDNKMFSIAYREPHPKLRCGEGGGNQIEMIYIMKTNTGEAETPSAYNARLKAKDGVVTQSGCFEPAM
jgi:Cytochrome P460